MNAHLFAASLPLISIAALIAFQRCLTPMLIAFAWLMALALGSTEAARHFAAMLQTKGGRRGGALAR